MTAKWPDQRDDGRVVKTLINKRRSAARAKRRPVGASEIQAQMSASHWRLCDRFRSC